MSNTVKIGIREINGDNVEEVELVAERMQLTLTEVIGENLLHTHDWLVQRVLWHLDPSKVTGAVFLAEYGYDGIVGHTIVRLDQDDDGNAIGLISTTYVVPGARKQNVASCLLRRGEEWIAEKGVFEAVTYTDRDNAKLQNLYVKHGYAMSPMPDNFVKLARDLSGNRNVSQ